MQWGLWSQNNTYANVLFSTAYPQQCLNVTASDYNDTSNDTGGIGEALLLSDVTVNGFRVSKQNVSIKTIWISIGKQQWGYEQNNEIVTLLLPYTTAYIPVGCAALLDAEFSLTIQDNSKFYRPVRSTAYWFTIGS